MRRRPCSSDLLRRRTHERLFEAAVDLAESRNPDPFRGQSMQDLGGGGVVTFIRGLDRSIGGLNTADGRQWLEDRDRTRARQATARPDRGPAPGPGTDAA